MTRMIDPDEESRLLKLEQDAQLRLQRFRKSLRDDGNRLLIRPGNYVTGRPDRFYLFVGSSRKLLYHWVRELNGE